MVTAVIVIEVTVVVVTVVIVTSFSKDNLTPQQPMKCSRCSFSRFLRCFIVLLPSFTFIKQILLQFNGNKKTYLKNSLIMHARSQKIACVQPPIDSSIISYQMLYSCFWLNRSSWSLYTTSLWEIRGRIWQLSVCSSLCAESWLSPSSNHWHQQTQQESSNSTQYLEKEHPGR